MLGADFELEDDTVLVLWVFVGGDCGCWTEHFLEAHGQVDDAGSVEAVWHIHMDWEWVDDVDLTAHGLDNLVDDSLDRLRCECADVQCTILDLFVDQVLEAGLVECACVFLVHLIDSLYQDYVFNRFSLLSNRSEVFRKSQRWCTKLRGCAEGLHLYEVESEVRHLYQREPNPHRSSLLAYRYVYYIEVPWESQRCCAR